jgi:hypothetical protein
MNILVTGANSFIAKNLIEVLTSDQITLFQRSKNDLPLHNNYSIVEYDLYYPKKSTRNLRFIPDIALLFAWNGTRGSQRDRFFLQLLNYYFSKRLILELIQIGTKRFFLAGSQAEYNISLFDKHFSGGSILHLNFVDRIINKKFMKDLIVHSVRQGVVYHAINYNLQKCINDHITVGKSEKCSICKKEIIENFERVVGFLVPVSNWSKERRELDHPNRQRYENS